MEVFNDTIIYICCPASIQTGGTEALHQLHYYMNGAGFRTVIAYYGVEEGKELTPQRYKKYLSACILLEEIEDNEKNIAIIPELTTRLKERFTHIRKCIWWLSVGFFDGLYTGKAACRLLLSLFKRFSFGYLEKVLSTIKYSYNRKIFQDVAVHFTASKYAFLYLDGRKVKNKEYLVEPISEEFLNAGMYTGVAERGNKVLYNPSKPSRFMQKLLKEGGIEFLPLKGYSPEEIIKLYRTSKLYVDFGAFGGPERIPKETVFNGCNIIVGRKNAAANDFDVAIDEQYKITRLETKEVVSKISGMLDNYEEHLPNFDRFRRQIDSLRENFIKQIMINFVRV